MTLRRVATNSAWLLLDKVLRLGGNLALTIWMARTIDPQAFGAFGFASAVAAIVTAIATLGLQGVVMRDMVREPKDARPSLVSAALALRLGASLLLFSGASIVVFVLRGGVDSAALLTMILVAAAIPQVFDVLEWVLLANERARLVTLTRLAVFGATAVARVAVILTHGSLEQFAAIILAEAGFGAFALLMLARREGIVPRFRLARRSLLSAYAQAAIPLVLASICVQVYMRADQLMIAEMLGHREAGLYAAAVRISEAWNFIPAAAMLALMPGLAAAHRRSEQDFMRSLSKVIGLLAGISLVFAAGVWASAPLLVAALYGPLYAGAADALGVHVFSCVFVTIGVASGPYFLNNGIFRLAMLQTFAGGLLNLALNLALIPRWGIVGAAYAAIASQFISAFALNALHPATRPLAWIQTGGVLARGKQKGPP